MTEPRTPAPPPEPAPVPVPVPESAAHTPGSYLEGSTRWWHGAFAFILTLTGAIVALGDLAPGRTALGLGLLAVMGLAYVLVGKRLILVTMGSPAGVGYVTILSTAGVAVTAIAPNGGGLILFIIFPHVWALLERKWAAVASCLIVITMISLSVWRAAQGEFTGDVIAAGMISAMFTLGLALLMGLSLSWLVEDNERKQQLITELQSAQAELAAAHHREGVLAERQRVAAEIHDTLAQGFMSILVLSQAPPATDQLTRIERTARENLAEARSLVEALEPDDLRVGSLADACRRVAERLDDEQIDLDVTFELVGAAQSIPVATEVVLLRATQEALTNVRKHAGAGQVGVTLLYGKDSTSVRIEDDGSGFDPATATNGFGLRGMRSRAEQAGGWVDVESTPGHGTIVQVVVP